MVSLPESRILPDGSRLELKEGARIAVDYSATTRLVTLLEGAAHFQVEKDAARPFVVTAQRVAVRAVGTAFLVESGSSRVEIIVTEGQVAVNSPQWSVQEAYPSRLDANAEPDPSSVLVPAGNRVSVQPADATAPAPAVQPMSVADIQERLAWRVPRLDLNFTPLADVVALFNAHGRVALMFEDPEMGKLKLSGILRADNVPVLLQILDTSYGVKSERRAGGDIILTRNDPIEGRANRQR
jgi:transmembrane sensor